MKSLKNYIFIGFFFLSLSAVAQIPSASFEGWSSTSFESIESWSTLGSVSKSTVKTEGDFAVRLDNNPDSEVQIGIVTNADLQSDFEGGFAYTDRPFSVEFDAKYDLAIGDSAQVLVYFKYEQDPVGIMDFKLTGASADTFTSFTIPISWFGFVNPDSVIIAISSAGFEDENIGKGYVIVDRFQFSSLGTPDDHIANQGFNNWVSDDVGHPEGWFTTDVFVKSVFGEAPDPSLVNRVPDSYRGDYSLKLANLSGDGEITPGIALTGKKFEDLGTPAFPVQSNHSYLRGAMKYLPKNGDTASITVMFFNSGIPIGGGEIAFGETVENWTLFEVEIEYFTTLSADSAFIIIANSDFDEPKSAETALWIDDLKFVEHTLAINELEKRNLVYPNPFTNQLTISTTDAAFTTMVYSITGEKMLESANHKTIDVSHLPSGIYIITYRSQNQSWQKKIIKQ